MIKEHLKLYKCLNANKVRYLVIGGIASIIYGIPRITLDVDIFVEPTLSNAIRLLAALKEAGFGTASLTTPKKILNNEINIFDDYIRLDVITRPKGLEFKKTWKRRVVKRVNSININFASLADIIKSKVKSARSIDKEDVKILKKILKNRKGKY